MVETVLAPPHAHPFEALLDEPFTGTFYHPRPQWQAQFLILGIVNMLAMSFQIGIHGADGVLGGGMQPLHVQRLRQVGQHRFDNMQSRTRANSHTARMSCAAQAVQKNVE